MCKHLPKKIIFAYSLAFICIATQFRVQQTSAETTIEIDNNVGKVQVNSTQKTTVNSESTTKTSDTIKINGKYYVNESKEVKGSSIDSNISVQVQDSGNGPTGTVKYKVNGEEKTEYITPGAEKEIKIETDEKKQEVKSSQNTKNFIEIFFMELEKIFSRFTSLFNTTNKET